MADPTDNLVLDLNRENPNLIARLQAHTAQLALLPGWRSHHHAYARTGGVAWHWNHHPEIPPGPGRGPLPPPPGGAMVRRTVTHALDDQRYELWYKAWELLKEMVSMPELELVRVYLNAYVYGSDTALHPDSPHEDEVTIVLAVHESWNRDWGGETVLVDPQGDVVRAVVPWPGRAFCFRSAVLHGARPVARSCPMIRRVCVFKAGVWPAGLPVRGQAPDALEHRAAGIEPFERMGALEGDAKLAAAVEWISRSPAGAWPAGGRTVAAAAVSAALHARALGAGPETVMAALGFALVGGGGQSRRLFGADRRVATELLGEEGLERALRYASIAAPELDRWSRVIADGASPPEAGIDLATGPQAPLGAGPVRVDQDELAELLLVHAARLRAQEPDPTVALEGGGAFATP